MKRNHSHQNLWNFLADPDGLVFVISLVSLAITIGATALG